MSASEKTKHSEWTNILFILLIGLPGFMFLVVYSAIVGKFIPSIVIGMALYFIYIYFTKNSAKEDKQYEETLQKQN